jgi:hypothetical protein
MFWSGIVFERWIGALMDWPDGALPARPEDGGGGRRQTGVRRTQSKPGGYMKILGGICKYNRDPS